MIIAYLDRINLSVVLSIPEFVRSFRLSDTDRGLLNSAFFWSYAIMQIPAGYLVDRYGSKYTFATGFVLWSLVSALTTTVTSMSQLFTLRLILGVCESVVTPASMRWIRYHFAEKERGFALGIYTTGSKIGSAIAVPVTAALIQYFGWRGMFLSMGLGCAVWLIPWLIAAPNDLRRSVAQTQDSSRSLSLRELLSSRAIWGVIIGAFCYSYFYMFYMTWLPSYFVEHRHLSMQEMSSYSAASFAGMAIVAAPAGWLADRLIAKGRDAIRTRKLFTILGMLIASIEVFGVFTESNTMALFFAVVSLAGLGFTTANYWALTQALVPQNSIGRVIGIQNCANSLSGIAASLLTGWLKKTTGGYHAPFIAILVFLLIGVLAYHFLAREEFKPKSAESI